MAGVHVGKGKKQEVIGARQNRLLKGPHNGT